MPELHNNGNYEAYLAQLFNPMGSGGQYNPYGYTQSNPYGAQFNPYGNIGTGFGGVPSIGAQMQNPWQQNPWQQTPWTSHSFLQGNMAWPQQQHFQNPVQSSLSAVHVAQQVLTRQAAQAIQCAQALQTLLQFVQNVAAQQSFGMHYGQGNTFAGIGQGIVPTGLTGLQPNLPLQTPFPHLAMQQPAPFRYGLAA